MKTTLKKKTVKKKIEISKEDKKILNRWKKTPGYRIEEIREKIATGELKVDLKGHNSVSISKDIQIENLLNELDRYIKDAKDSIKRLPDNIFCLAKIHAPLENGKYRAETGYHCWDCNKTLYLTILNDTISYISASEYWKLAEESDSKYDFKLESLDQIPKCEITKYDITDKIVNEIDLPTGELVIANFFKDEQIYRSKKFDSINALANRIGLMQEFASKNVGYGQMGNMSIAVYKKKDDTEILFADPYAVDHYEDNHYWLTEELKKKNLNKKKKEEFKQQLEELIEPFKIDEKEYIYMGDISLSVWRWQCADRKTLKKYNEEINDKKFFETGIKNKKINNNKKVSSSKDYEYIIANVKSGKWVIEHYYDLTQGQIKYRNIFSKLYLKH